MKSLFSLYGDNEEGASSIYTLRYVLNVFDALVIKVLSTQYSMSKN